MARSFYSLPYQRSNAAYILVPEFGVLPEIAKAVDDMGWG